MKSLLILTALAVFVSCAGWTAYTPEEDPRFFGLSDAEWARQYLMPLDDIEMNHEPQYTGDLSEVENWDLRAESAFKDCIHEIRDQGSCGSCWAFATSEVASDRACIDSKKSVDLIFSPQYLMDCDKEESSCGGAATQRVIQWIGRNGIVTEKCYPYTAVDGTQCKKSCSKVEDPYKVWKFKDDTIWTGSVAKVEELQKALKDGPVYFSMQVENSFKQYKSGVFEAPTPAVYVGGHAVKCVGWGFDETRKDKSYTESHYWICANSWGARWGEDGFFRIRMN